MKRTYPVVLAVAVAVAIIAPIAQGVGTANPVAALEKKVKALQGRVAQLESQLAATKGDVAAAKNDIAGVQQRVGTIETGGQALASNVSALQTAVGTLTTGLACVRYRVLPLARYQGYVYSSDGGKSLGLTTAVDVPDAGETPQVYLAGVNPSCVSSAATLRLNATREAK